MGWVADSIDNDYRREQWYKRRMKRQNCKEKECKDCNYNNICEDKEENDGEISNKQ